MMCAISKSYHHNWYGYARYDRKPYNVSEGYYRLETPKKEDCVTNGSSQEQWSWKSQQNCDKTTQVWVLAKFHKDQSTAHKHSTTYMRS